MKQWCRQCPESLRIIFVSSVAMSCRDPFKSDGRERGSKSVTGLPGPGSSRNAGTIAAGTCVPACSFPGPSWAGSAAIRHFFDHVEGSAGAHVRNKVRFCRGRPGSERKSLYAHGPDRPRLRCPATAWREESYKAIADRVDRISVVKGPVQHAAEGPFDGFNLSDIFEYMSVDETAKIYAELFEQAAPGARLSTGT